MHYYDQKYPYLSYPTLYRSETGEVCSSTMYSIPVIELVELYRGAVGAFPRTFLDCGCATGHLLEQAEEIGIRAKGIDVEVYPEVQFQRFDNYRRMLKTKQIEIVSLTDYRPQNTDLSYCNGMLTSLSEKGLDRALSNLRRTKVMVAIHNTTEDVEEANRMGCCLGMTENRHRLTKTRDWWTNKIARAGFDVTYHKRLNCFCARSR